MLRLIQNTFRASIAGWLMKNSFKAFMASYLLVRGSAWAGSDGTFSEPPLPHSLDPPSLWIEIKKISLGLCYLYLWCFSSKNFCLCPRTFHKCWKHDTCSTSGYVYVLSLALYRIMYIAVVVICPLGAPVCPAMCPDSQHQYR